ncbi:MAG: GIY-YIG nuclease family protein [Leptospirales bacterium]|nr:GIY-YIG nuclease family protein [Leptospirales bacterium]
MNWVYMVECENGAYYTGFSVNLVRRYRRHLDGISGAKYIAAFKARSLVCCWEVHGTRSDSLKIEAYIKKMNRAFKEKIANDPKLLEALAHEHYGIAIASCDTALIEADAAAYPGKKAKL